MKNKMLSVAIPFYNEEENVDRVIRGIVRVFNDAALEDYEILAVNNGSWDKTGEILTDLNANNPRIRIVHVMKNKGLGWGILQGLAQARGEYLCIQCGDGQTEPDEIIRVFETLKKYQLDLCKVRRVVRGDGPFRAFISWVFNALSTIMFSVKTDDVNGLPKVMTRKAYEDLSLRSSDWFIDAEIMIKAARLRLKQGEVETEFLKREGGSSNVNWKTVMEFIKNMIKYRIKGFETEKCLKQTIHSRS
ncbi:MAG: glycosyltransferase family 2 protein [Candidatus Omnitrophica bacterium]|nr:glycosyltransferase family 2 protein [Candidatus Omnitrophota bacterium]